jgi:hypothetical protein
VLNNCCKIIFVGVIKIFALTVVAQAAEVYQSSEFSMTIPDGWIQIPKNIIDSNTQQLGDMLPGVQVKTYDCGFQMDNALTWFDYPYVLVQINREGRISEKHLEMMDKYPAQEYVDDHGKGLRPVMSEVQTGKMYYDRINEVVWFVADATVKDVGKVRMLSATVLTETGFIQIGGSALVDNFETYETVFRSMALSVALNSKLQYQAHGSTRASVTAPKINWEKIAEMALTGAILASAVTFGSYLRRKRKTAKPTRSKNDAPSEF